MQLLKYRLKNTSLLIIKVNPAIYIYIFQTPERVHVGVGVVEESRFVKKADDLRIVISLGESGISDGDGTVDAGSSGTINTWETHNLTLSYIMSLIATTHCGL